MLQPWQTGKIIRIEQEAPRTRRFWIQLPEAANFDFKPGQFVTLDLPIHEKPGRRWRSYSIASWPDGSNIFELVIVMLDGGAGTNYLFNQCSVGSELIVRGPQGVFTLPDPIEKDLFFICTGTGIAPFRSMVHHIYNHHIPHKDIYLIFGTRQLQDCLYRQEMTELAKNMASFHYIPTFSQETPDPANTALRTGYVHSIYEELCRRPSEACAVAASAATLIKPYQPGAMESPLTVLPLDAIASTGPAAERPSSPMEESSPSPMMEELKAAVSTLPPAYFFLCGWKNMIDEARERIQALGYDRKSVHQELYG